VGVTAVMEQKKAHPPGRHLACHHPQDEKRIL